MLWYFYQQIWTLKTSIQLLFEMYKNKYVPYVTFFGFLTVDFRTTLEYSRLRLACSANWKKKMGNGTKLFVLWFWMAVLILRRILLRFCRKCSNILELLVGFLMLYPRLLKLYYLFEDNINFSLTPIMCIWCYNLALTVYLLYSLKLNILTTCKKLIYWLYFTANRNIFVLPIYLNLFRLLNF